MNKYTVRIAAFVLVCFAVITLPWWIMAIILVGLTVYFSLYIEVLFFGFLFDILYSAHNSFPYTALTLALVLLSVVSLVRPYIRT